MSEHPNEREMKQLSPETVWQMNEQDLLSLLNSGRLLSKTRKINFYAPSFMYYRTAYYCSSTSEFPTISVTGKGCALKCRHCGGLVLETMYPVTTPENLFDLCKSIKAKGALGCLISGGCLPDGSVPLKGFAETIRRVKNELGLTVFVHSGIIDVATAEALKSAGIDAALIDVIGSDETIREIYNLNVTVKDYDRSLKVLRQAGIVTVPHVVAGLHNGRLRGELDALHMIEGYSPSAVVIIAFTPIRGTDMENVHPPKPLDIARVVATARLMLPQVPVVLGCMRPKGKHREETDILAVKAGANALAFPTERAVKFAEDNGYKVAFSSLCCSQIYADIVHA
jgi:uncharacterized radical SAM superfamily protein